MVTYADFSFQQSSECCETGIHPNLPSRRTPGRLGVAMCPTKGPPSPASWPSWSSCDVLPEVSPEMRCGTSVKSLSKGGDTSRPSPSPSPFLPIAWNAHGKAGAPAATLVRELTLRREAACGRMESQTPGVGGLPKPHHLTRNPRFPGFLLA